MKSDMIIINMCNNKTINMGIDLKLLLQVLHSNIERDFAYSDDNVIVKNRNKYIIMNRRNNNTGIAADPVILYSPVMIIENKQILIHCEYVITNKPYNDTIDEICGDIVTASK